MRSRCEALLAKALIAGRMMTPPEAWVVHTFTNNNAVWCVSVCTIGCTYSMSKVLCAALLFKLYVHTRVTLPVNVFEASGSKRMLHFALVCAGAHQLLSCLRCKAKSKCCKCQTKLIWPLQQVLQNPPNVWLNCSLILKWYVVPLVLCLSVLKNRQTEGKS